MRTFQMTADVRAQSGKLKSVKMSVFQFAKKWRITRQKKRKLRLKMMRKQRTCGHGNFLPHWPQNNDLRQATNSLNVSGVRFKGMQQNPFCSFIFCSVRYELRERGGNNCFLYFWSRSFCSCDFKPCVLRKIRFAQIFQTLNYSGVLGFDAGLILPHMCSVHELEERKKISDRWKIRIEHSENCILPSLFFVTLPLSPLSLRYCDISNWTIHFCWPFYIYN